MIVCFDCSRETKNILDELLHKSDYLDYDEIISVAIANLSILERQSDKTNILFTSRDLINYSHKGQLDDLQRKSGASLPFISKDEHLLERPLSPRSDLIFVNMPNIDEYKSIPPISKWIFGQYNKFLPIKISCRILANLIIEEGCLNLEKVAIQISNIAASLGNYLENYDKKHEIPRHMRFSTAFPSNGPSGEKSRRRFANQFVGNINSQGDLSGLLYDMRFVNICKENNQISLTKPGWDFALLQNPVLSSDLQNIQSKLSDEEIVFLLNHIKKNIPVEFYAYNLILDSISKGHNRPEALDSFLKEYLPEENITDSFISTQRSGVISRLTDLSLIKREHDGNKVFYLISELGSKYLNNHL